MKGKKLALSQSGGQRAAFPLQMSALLHALL
jgi:hypothetical protein